MRHLRWLAVGLSLMASPALAGSQTSIGYTPGSGVNVSGFTCFSTLFCAGHVLIDNTGAEKGTSGNPVFVQPNGSGTQPISGSINPSGGPVLATATTADPSYSNGTSNALSTNLAGYMRIIAPASQLLAYGSSTVGTDPGQGIVALCQNGASPAVSATQTVALQCNGTGQLVTTSGNIAQGAATSGQTGILSQVAVVSGAQTYTAGNTNPLTQTTQGYLNVNVAAGSAANAAASATGSAVPAQAGYTGVKIGANLAGLTGTVVGSSQAADINIVGINGAAAPTGTGTSAGAQRVVLSSDSTGPVAISQTTPGSTNGVSPVLSGTGGWAPVNLVGLTNTAVSIKASAGQLGMLYCYNPNSSNEVYVQVFNQSGGITVGSTTPAMSVGIPPVQNGGFPMNFPGIQFTTAMSVAATSTPTGGTAPGTPINCTGAYN